VENSTRKSRFKSDRISLGITQTYLRNKHFKKGVPRTLSSLKVEIRKFWRDLTPEKCQSYIMHLHKVIPVVLEKEEAASGY